IHHNGQMGISGGGSAASVFENNELSFNNTCGYDSGWEAGGSKWVHNGTAGGGGADIRNNWVHDNNGPGLWNDGANYNTIYEYHLVENNAGAGIDHEISFNA